MIAINQAISTTSSVKTNDEKELVREDRWPKAGGGSLLKSALKQNFYKVSKANLKRSKRSLNDIQRLINEDEFMAMLICDMCDKNSCQPKYCIFCQQCQIDYNNDGGSVAVRNQRCLNCRQSGSLNNNNYLGYD